LDRQAPKIAAFLCAQMKPEEKASALLDAIEKGEYSYIAFLRETGVDINAPLDVYGNTAFHRFIEKKQSLVIIIAEGGADVDKPNHYGNRPMHIAALYNNEQAIIGLSGCGADVNATNNLGETPLHVAAKHGNQSAVNMLLKRNADLTLKDNLGQSIIDVATPQMRVIIEKFSLDKMAYVELDAILAEGDLNKLKDVAKKWFGHIDGEGKEGLTILAKTVLSGNHSAAEILLDAGANPNEALINAVMSDSGVMVKMLILAGADPKRELRGGQKLLDMASPENKSAVERVIEEALAERQLIVEADAIKARIQAKQELFLKQQKVLMDQSALMEKGLATLAVLSEGSASGVARLKELTRKHLSIKQKMMEGMNLGGLVEGLGENVDRIEGAKPTPKVQSTVASLIARSGNSKT
jgi:ankyrin repeat protein